MSSVDQPNRKNHLQERSTPSCGKIASGPQLPGKTSAPPSAHLHTRDKRGQGGIEPTGSANTRRAYAADWKHFSAWCRRQGLSPLPPVPQTIGLYFTACASGTVAGGTKPGSVSTIERRLSSLTWNCMQRGQPLDRRDQHIAMVLAGIRNSHAKLPVQKDALLPEDIIAMLQTLDQGSLRGLRDRAMLLLGFAGGLRRSEITGLDVGRDQTEDARGWIEVLDQALILTLRGKNGWRKVEISRGSSDATCPVITLQTWLSLARISHGPLFRRVTGKGKAAGADRLNDQEVARLVKRAALAAGVRGDLSERERAQKFSSHSLRARLASSAEAYEQQVQQKRAPLR